MKSGDLVVFNPVLFSYTPGIRIPRVGIVIEESKDNCYSVYWFDNREFSNCHSSYLVSYMVL